MMSVHNGSQDVFKQCSKEFRMLCTKNKMLRFNLARWLEQYQLSREMLLKDEEIALDNPKNHWLLIYISLIET